MDRNELLTALAQCADALPPAVAREVWYAGGTPAGTHVAHTAAQLAAAPSAVAVAQAPFLDADAATELWAADPRVGTRNQLVAENPNLAPATMVDACVWLAGRGEPWPRRTPAGRWDQVVPVPALVEAMAAHSEPVAAPGWEITAPADLRLLAGQSWATPLVLQGLAVRTATAVRARDRELVSELYATGTDRLRAGIQRVWLAGDLGAAGLLDDQLAARLAEHPEVARDTLTHTTLPARATASAVRAVVGLQHPYDLARAVVGWSQVGSLGPGELADLADALADDLDHWDVATPSDPGSLARLIADHGSSHQLQRLVGLLADSDDLAPAWAAAADRWAVDDVDRILLAASAADIGELAALLDALDPELLPDAVDLVLARPGRARTGHTSRDAVWDVLWCHVGSWHPSTVRDQEGAIREVLSRSLYRRHLEPLPDEVVTALVARRIDRTDTHLAPVTDETTAELVRIVADIPVVSFTLDGVIGLRRLPDDLVARIVCHDERIALRWARGAYQLNPPTDAQLELVARSSPDTVERAASSLAGQDTLSPATRLSLAPHLPANQRTALAGALERHTVDEATLVDIAAGCPALTARVLADDLGANRAPRDEVATALLDAMGSPAPMVLANAARAAAPDRLDAIGRLALTVPGVARFTPSQVPLARALAGPLAERLGDEPGPWRTFVELAAGWDGTLAEILDMVDAAK